MAAAAGHIFIAGPVCPDVAFNPHGDPVTGLRTIGNCSDVTDPDTYWHPVACARPGATMTRANVCAAAPRAVCGACHVESHLEPWVGPARADISNESPAGPAPPGGYTAAMQAGWTQFHTRLCKSCEEYEQQKFYIYNRYPANPPPPAVPNAVTAAAQLAAQQAVAPAQMANWPKSSCTCHWVLGVPRPVAANGPVPGLPEKWCYADRWQEWLDLRTTRDRNDRWLKTTARIPATGVTCMAKDRTIANRMKPRHNAARACRCGATPDTSILAPRPVYMCMGCEGIINFAIPCGTLAEQTAAALAGTVVNTDMSKWALSGRELKRRTPRNANHATRSRGNVALGRWRDPTKV